MTSTLAHTATDSAALGAHAFGPRIEREEARTRFRDTPLLTLGAEAFSAKRARYGDRVTYVVNRHINPTNLCIHSCRFCDFAAKPDDAHAYTLSEDQILEHVAPAELTEIHIVGGLWHTWGFSRSLELVRRIRAARPDVWIKAFTAVEVEYFARMERVEWKDIMSALMDAGVNALPGGGAEVLSERIHQELFASKIGAEEWLGIHEMAHRLGLVTNATLLFGHIETDDEIVDHLLLLRGLQDRAPGFECFIPLAYQPGASRIVTRLAPAPRCLRVIALARLVLDNIPHIKAYWPSLHIETAVAALNFGADDLDGTLQHERIMSLAGSSAPSTLSTRQLERMVREAGQIPVRRDGAYRVAGES